MESISVNQFRDNLKSYIDTVIDTHQPLLITRRNGENFIVMSESDWASEQETLYVLQNQRLMNQIAASHQTFIAGTGRPMTKEQEDEIDRL